MLKVMERDMKTSFALKEAETIQVRIAKNLYTVQLPALFEVKSINFESNRGKEFTVVDNFI